MVAPPAVMAVTGLSEIVALPAAAKAVSITDWLSDRVFRRVLIAIALTGLALGLLAWPADRGALAGWMWAAGTLPVLAGLAASMVRDVIAGRIGVDAVAFVSISAALLLGEELAAIVVGVMYAGGNLLEDFAVARAERDLRSLVDRAPRVAHRRKASSFEDVPVDQIAIGDVILVRGGEVIPVDGVILAANATIDEAALALSRCW